MSRQWMPIYWGDYIKKTMHLSTVEHGAYLLLIAHCWNTGEGIPDKDDVLRRITRTTSKQWNSIRGTIQGFFEIVDGRWEHERVNKELRTSSAVSTSQSSKAELRWKNKENQQKPDAAGIAEAIPRVRDTTTTTTVVDSLQSSTTPPPQKKPHRVSLDELSTDHVAEWLSRKRANGKFLRHDPQEVLDYFKDYCLSKGKKYADYTAAYRNAFEWERFTRNSAGAPQGGNRGQGVQLGKSELVRQALLESAREAGLLDDDGIEQARRSGLLLDGETA